MGFDRMPGVGDKIGYARVSTADQDPRLQLDALDAEGCLTLAIERVTREARFPGERR
jgi:DNA invertase Pin-like site-specific DNA recombinase